MSALVYPPGIESCIIFQTNHLAISEFCKILKTNEIVRKIFKTLELWLLWSFLGDTSLGLVDSVSNPNPILSRGGHWRM
jgi:hypothetical protein